MKAKLKLSTKGYAKNPDKYFEDLYNKFEKEFQTTGEGLHQSKQQAILMLRSYYNEAREDLNKSRVAALNYATKKYDRSLAYRSAEERLESFTLKDYLQGASKEDLTRFRSLTRGVKGRFTKFNPLEIKYKGVFESDDKRHYKVETYQDVVIITFNSPNERVFFSRYDIPEEYIGLAGIYTAL